MVQPADLRHDDDPTRARRLDRTRLGAVLLERQMSPRTVVPTENSIRVEGRNLVSCGGQAFVVDAQAKLMASTRLLWRKLRNP